MKRKSNLDLLRIILGIMIIIIHMSSKEYGGISANVNVNTMQYVVCWGLLAFCFVGVNCFALLSGYLSYGKVHKYKKIVNLYLELLFFSITITLFFIFFYKEKITINLLFKTVLPINSMKWWYINVYIVLFFIMPYLDKIIENCNYDEFKKMFKLFFILFCITNTLFLQNDIFYMNSGFTVLWISLLYTVGAGIQKFKIEKFFSNKKSIFFYFALTILTILSRIIIDNLSLSITGKNIGSGLLYSYLSPTIFLSSVLLLIYFINLDVRLEKSKKIISILAQGSLSSYIVHVHPLFLKFFIKDKFIFLAHQSWYIQLALTVLIAITIYVICILMNSLRLLFFKLVNILYIIISKYLKIIKKT